MESKSRQAHRTKRLRMQRMARRPYTPVCAPSLCAEESLPLLLLSFLHIEYSSGICAAQYTAAYVCLECIYYVCVTAVQAACLHKPTSFIIQLPEIFLVILGLRFLSNLTCLNRIDCQSQYREHLPVTETAKTIDSAP